MRTAKLLPAACLVLLGVSGAASSSTDPAPAPAPGTAMRDSGPSGRIAGIASLPACACSDIAYIDNFRSGGLGYVASQELARAARAVASGESRHSPGEVRVSLKEADANSRDAGWSAGTILFTAAACIEDRTQMLHGVTRLPAFSR